MVGTNSESSSSANEGIKSSTFVFGGMSFLVTVLTNSETLQRHTGHTHTRKRLSPFTCVKLNCFQTFSRVETQDARSSTVLQGVTARQSICPVRAAISSLTPTHEGLQTWTGPNRQVFLLTCSKKKVHSNWTRVLNKHGETWGGAASISSVWWHMWVSTGLPLASAQTNGGSVSCRSVVTRGRTSSCASLLARCIGKLGHRRDCRRSSYTCPAQRQMMANDA